MPERTESCLKAAVFFQTPVQHISLFCSSSGFPQTDTSEAVKSLSDRTVWLRYNSTFGSPKTPRMFISLDGWETQCSVWLHLLLNFLSCTCSSTGATQMALVFEQTSLEVILRVQILLSVTLHQSRIRLLPEAELGMLFSVYLHIAWWDQSCLVQGSVTAAQWSLWILFSSE